MTSALQGGLEERWRAAVGGLPRAFWVLWLGTLINRAGAFVLPFLTLYLTEHRGLTAAQAGNVVATFGIGSLLANPVGGQLADGVGRKPTMVLSLTLAAVMLVVLGLATGFAQLIGATFLLGFCLDLYRPASAAAVADLVEPADRLRAFTHLYWAINLGAAIAPLAGGLVPKAYLFALFVGDAVSTLACALLVLWKVPETRPAPSQKEAGLRSSMFAPFRDRTFVPFLGVTMLVAVLFLQFLVALPVAMKAEGLSELDYGLALSLNGALIVVLQPFVSRWVARQERAHVLSASAALIGVGYGLYAVAGPWLAVWMAGVVLWTLGEIAMAPVNSAAVADAAPTHLRGRYQGAFNMTFAFAWILAPVMGGEVVSRWGTTALWLGSLSIGLAAAVLHLRYEPSRRAQRLAQISKQ